ANVAFILKMRLQLLRDIGACMSPFNAWASLQGVETLHLRMDRICANALKVAELLAAHDKVTWVNYPGLKTAASHAAAKKYLSGGFGGLLGFGLKGGYEARSEEHTSELQSRENLVCRLLLEKKKRGKKV